MIDVRSLRVIKKGRTICHVPELTVRPGQRLAVIGANGCGKSTLLRVLAGLEREYQGQCEVHAAPRERTYVHQDPYLLRGSVLGNVAFGLRARGQSRSVATKAALDCLERFGIRELASRRARNLSGGERRRVALARAVVLEPRLMLLDEPLSDLDAEGIESACRVLRALKDTTMLIASPAPLLPELAAEELRLVSPQRDFTTTTAPRLDE